MDIPELTKFPERLLIDFNGACNLSCKMCMVHGDNPEKDKFATADKDRIMDPRKLEKVLDEIVASGEKLPQVWTALNGEPLFGPHYIENVTMLKERGFTVLSHTNGILLDKKMSQFIIDIGLDVLSCSFDAITPETYKIIRQSNLFDRVVANLKQLIELRGDSKTPRIEVSMTVQEENEHEVDEFLEYWSEYVDVIRINATFTPGKAVYGANFTLPKERTTCASLYQTMPLFWDGHMGLCCLDPFGKAKIGNAFESTLEEVWNGKTLNKVREIHEQGQGERIDLCKGCENWASFDYEEEITDKFLIRRSRNYAYYNVLSRLSNWTDKIRGTHESVKLDEAMSSNA